MSDGVLPEQDVRALVRLLGDVAAMQSGIAERKTRLMDGLAELVEADVWMWNVTSMSGGDYGGIRVVQRGLSDRQMARYFEASYQTDALPEMVAVAELMTMGEPFTRRRQELVADDVWQARARQDSAYFDLNIDQSIYTLVPVAGGVWSCAGLHRHWGRPPFTEREARLVHIVFSEVGWLHRAELPGEEDADLVPRLTPRLRTVFGLMMDGFSRSQIAEHLSLSSYTVRDYMSEIYRHFGVGSQVELMRRLTVGDGRDRP